jgi:4-hydroxyacetophenone monooxygenase
MVAAFAERADAMAAVEASVRSELRAASDAVIEDAVGHADPMVLRGVLYQLTGDPEIKGIALKKVRLGRIETVVPATDADTALLRRKAAEFLKRYRDAGAGPMELGPRERLPESLSLIVGQPIKEEALDLMIEETALDPWARALKWQATPDPQRLENFTVTIIGAGMGGLNAAVQLKRAGIRYSVIEKNSGVGGTWYENRYPGARVDTPSRSYMNLYGVDFPYPYAYGTHLENQKYYDWVASHFDLNKDITFNTEVRSLTWNEATSMWEIAAEGPEGRRTLRSNAVITGVGFLNRPNMPTIEGMAEFAGQAWHTARWPDNVDLRGKRIAVIGTGCTGYQLVPELALVASHVTVFQRTPQWLFPVPGYLAKSPEQLLWLDRNLPLHTNFMRFRNFYGPGPDFAKIFDIDPNFSDPYSVSEVNKGARDRSIEFLQKKLRDPRLVALMTPNHPAWSARPVVVDPEYCILDAIQRDNVTLVTDGIKRINRTGIEGSDGSQHDVDIIVYATGFRANDFLYPMTITGRGGKTIEQLWAADGARAYLGCMMPGFPNLWALYGPNTNGGLPVAQFREMTMLYAMQCMEKLILEGKHTIEVKEDAYWRYNEIVDKGNSMKVWADPRAHNYWWTQHGRTASQIPFTGYEVREFLLRPDFADLEIR